jgi:hypothetical protein
VRDGELISKKQDRPGDWRKAKLPDYANNLRLVIDERMKKLGRLGRNPPSEQRRI